MRKWTNDTGSAGSYSAVFDAFGQVVSQSGSRPPYGFEADWRYRDDGDAGLLHIGARWYDPVVGRWITADKYLGSIFDPLSLNRYTYCENEPLQYIDNGGLQRRAIGVGMGLLLILILYELYNAYQNYQYAKRVIEEQIVPNILDNPTVDPDIREEYRDILRKPSTPYW